jgi:glycerophosphoryl diester phosphodiesterase
MLQRVQFGGEWEDVRKLYPAANARESTAGAEPGVTAEQVRAYHQAGKAVIANFSANGHEMDLDGMRAALAAGVDAINVDYPRLGADAVGLPVERKLEALAAQANAGESDSRVRAILQLARYRGFPLQAEFTHWLLDADDHISRAAALALATVRPARPIRHFQRHSNPSTPM